MSSSSSSSSSLKKYDVFLSFRGDTRHGFTDHLYTNINKKGLIYTFKDDYELQRGEIIAPALFKAIEDSQIAIVVLSEEYASSTWCLKELAKIVECMGPSENILPIFYQVDPSDLRKHTGSFGKALKEHEQSGKHDPAEIQKWKDALKAVADVAGSPVEKNKTHEAEFIDNFVNTTLSQKLGVPSTKTLRGLFGMESRLEKLGSLVGKSAAAGDDDARFIAIYGMSGIGKSTLARTYYDRKRMSDKFDGNSFLANVREVCEKKENGLVHLQKQLLLDILRVSFEIGDVNTGVDLIKGRIRRKRVIVVLDDVNSVEQLDALAEEDKWFGKGSIIIVTTKDKSLLNKKFTKYEAEVLNRSEALQLFSWKAFETARPPNDYIELSKQVLQDANGHPLALQVLGSFLRGKDIKEWKSALDIWKRYSKGEIVKKLKISFDALEKLNKHIFLDIACFFNGYDRDYVAEILKIRYGFSPHSVISTLIDKSLLSTQRGNHRSLRMHDLLQKMALDIVRNESSDEPGRQSRLWDWSELCHVLDNNTGTEKVEAIVTFQKESTGLSFEAISNMKRLKLLMILDSSETKSDYGLTFVHLGYLSNDLRLLHWNGFPFKNFPSSFRPNELVHLTLIESNLEHLWNSSIKPLCNLKVIDLRYSGYFHTFGDFKVVPNLERLILEGCVELSEIHPSITSLSKLITLNLKDCTSLQSFPERLRGLNSLQTLNLNGCSKLSKLPEDTGDLKSLRKLDVKGSGVKHLPSSIKLNKDLETLFSENLPPTKFKNITVNTTTQPIVKIDLPSDFRSLTNLNLRCRDLSNESFPDEFGCLVSLEDLDLSGNQFSALPPSIKALSKLKMLDLKFCRCLTSLGPELPSSLEKVNVNYCTSLESFLDPTKPNHDMRCSAFCVDCSKLVEKQDSQMTAIAALERFLSQQDSHCSSRGFQIVLPGNEIPEWFCEKSSGSSISKKLNPDWNRKEFKGLALAVCFRSDISGVDFSCEMRVDDSEVEMARHFYSYIGRSDHLWLLFVPCDTSLVFDSRGRNLKISFQSMDGDDSSCGPCGVRLVYKKDIEELNKITSNYRNQQGYHVHSSRSNSEEIVSSSSIKFKKLAISSTPTIVKAHLPFLDPRSIKELDLSGQNLSNEAFSDEFDRLVSLEDLNLDNSPFSALPKSIKALSKLKKLSLAHCERLRSLGPELPSSLEMVIVDYCTSLESFLDPKMPNDIHCSAFCVDCLKLVEKQDSKMTAFGALKRYLQNRHHSSQGFNMVLPGNEIPEWFTKQSSGPSISKKLNPDWCDNVFEGFAFAVCFGSDSPDNFPCHVRVDDKESELTLRLFGYKGSSSHHLWLAFMPCDYDDIPMFEWKDSRGNLEISFHAETSGESCFTSCGVRLVYKKDIDQFNQITSEYRNQKEDAHSSSHSKRVVKY